MLDQGNPSDEPVLRFDRVGLSYGPGSDVLADVSLSLLPGSMTFLTGPSGAGKSTLLKLSYLALRPTAGKISLFGMETWRLRRKDFVGLRRRIGVVFQEFRLLDHLTAYENVALPLRVMGRKEASYREDVIELLTWVGLGDRLSARPATLSGGEKQRVALARAVLKRPRIIILDEATSALDSATERRVQAALAEICRGTTTLVIAHRLSTVVDADEILVLDQGRVVERGSHAELLRAEGLYARLWRRQAAEQARSPQPPPAHDRLALATGA